jgi:hypothetical protein
MPSNIQFKRGTAAALYALNPVLLRGEPGLEIDTNKVKYGNGVTPWRDLPYSNPALEVVDGGEFTAGAIPAVPGTFSPPTLPGLKLWLDADNADYVHRVANRVSLWEDASDSDAKFVQSNKVNRPSVANQLANQDVVTFDGENDAMIGKLDLPEEFTLLVALRRRGASADGKVIAAYTANNNTELVLCGTETGGEFGVFFDGEYSATQAVDNLVPVVYTLQFSLAGLSTRLNGLNTVSVEGFTVPPMTHLSLGGSRSDFADDNYSGDIAEIVLYDSVLSAADLLDAENYMMERWSVVSAVHPLREGMKAFWPLNEESGNRLDITDAEVPLTQTGTVGFDSGVIENAAEFTGGNNYLQAPSDFALDGSFAISAWFKAASMAGGRSVLVQNWAAGNASGQVELGFGDDGSDTNAVFGRIATDDDIYTVVVPDLEANLWHHVVLVYSATANTLTLYLNGLQAAQVATLGSFSAGNIPLRVGIGDQTATQNDLACVVDQLGIWDRVLSLQDVQMLYNYELGKEDFTADLYGDNVSLLLHMDKPANAVVGTDGGNGDPYFNDVSLLLHMNGPGFTDSSAGGLTVTANGNPEISTTQSKFGGASGYFDGSSCLTTIPENLTLAATNWTVEMWLYPLANSGYKSLFAHQICSTPQFGYEIALDLDGAFPGRNVRVFFGDGPGIGYGPGHLNGLFPVPDADVTNKWTHLAVTREGNSVRCFWNGVQIGATAESSVPINPLVGVTDITIGGRYCGSNGSLDAGFNGYIDDLRITKGVARYTANFTPPTAEFPDQAGQSLLDPDFDKVSLLLKMDGANGSTTFTDSSPNALTVTVEGDAVISTAQSKFGGASGYFSGGTATLEYTSVLDLKDGDWTVETWWRAEDDSGDHTLFAVGTDNVGGAQVRVSAYPSASAFRLLCDAGSGWINTTLAGTYSIGQWYHVAATRAGNTFTLFIDGVQILSFSYGGSLAAYTGVTAIGFDGGAGGAFASYMNGYIDDLRITKGLARYTANFTPPTASFPLGYTKVVTMPPAGETVLLLHFDGANGSTTFTDSGENGLTVTVHGAAQISTTQSKFGGSSLLLDNSENDWVSLDGSNNFAFGTEDFTIEAWIYVPNNGDAPRWVVSSYDEAGSASPFAKWAFGLNPTTLWFLAESTTPFTWSLIMQCPTPVPRDAWVHVAVARSAGQIRVFLNGVIDYEANSGINLIVGDTVAVGTLFENGSSRHNSFDGYIDELRIVKGAALYTADFTPPAFPHPPLNASLLLPFEGANGSAAFTDLSANNFALTPVGTPTISTAQSKFGTSSGSFDGSSHLELTANSALSFGNLDFTIEAWVYTSNGSADQSIAGGRTTGDWMFAINPNFVGIGFGQSGLSWDLLGAFSFNANQWYHVAVTRQGAALRLFVDGTLVADTLSNTASYTIADTLAIGGRQDGSSVGAFFNGYIDDLRIVTGYALYTANFAPPSASFAPTTNASLLMHFDGANGSTTFKNNAKPAQTLTYEGDVEISTAFSKFGGAALYQPQSGGSVMIPYSPDLDLGTGDFTIEFWYYPLSLFALGSSVIQGGGNPDDPGGDWCTPVNTLFVGINDYGTTFGLGRNCNPFDAAATIALTTNEWHHLAVTRQGSTVYFFQNGVLMGTGTSTQNYLTQQTYGMRICDPLLSTQIYGAQYGVSIDGYLDELRIVKGQALYTANFTPPTTPFSTSTNPAPDLLLHFDGANGSTTFTDSGKNQLSVTANGAVVISTAQSRFGGASGYFDGQSASKLVIPANTNFDTEDFTIEAWVWIDATTCNPDSGCVCEIGSHSGLGSGGLLFAVGERNGNWISWAWFGPDGGNGAFPITSETITPGQWTHLAFTRAGNAFKIFVNGVIGSAENRIVSFNPPDNSIQIGASLNGAPVNSFGGYIDELRIIKGTALYTENFNPPAAPFLNPTITLIPPPGDDPYFNNVFMLFHFDGADGSDVFTDSSTNALTATPNYDVQISTTESKFGSASLQVVHTPGNYLDVPCDFNLASDSWTLECWVNAAPTCCDLSFNILTTNNNQFPSRLTIDFIVDDGSIYPRILTENNVVHSTSLYPADNSNLMPIPTHAPYVPGTWAHLAFVNNAETNNFSMYVDGVRVFSRVAIPPMVQRDAVQIGQQYDNSFDGTNYYLDDLRLTVGVARYTDNFTPPTAAFPDPAGGGGGGGTGPITTFIDTSKHNHEVTATGSAYLNLEDIKYGNASGEFAGGHCEIAMSPEFAFDDGDFTVEFWGKLSYVQYSAVFSTASTAEEAGTYLIGFSDDTNMFGFCYDMDNFTFVSANIAEYYNTWAHYAFVRASGVLKMYINGAEVATANTNINLDGGTQTTAVIGRRWTNEDDYYLDGLIDDFRITKGVARYIAEFNPPTKALPDPAIPPSTQPTGDPYAEYVTLLLHMNGSDGSTTFTDNSYLQNTVTAEGNAAISTAQSKFGGASLYQSVSGSYLSVPYNDGFSFDGDFTMEAWVNPSSVADGMAIVGVYGNGSYPLLISFVYGDNRVRFWWNGSSSITSTSQIQPNQWSHVAVSRNAGVIRLFVNGVQEASANDSAVIESTTNEPLTIGRHSFGGNGSTWFGYIDDLRITKGVARYTANFTPPTVPFPNPFVPGPTADLLLHFDGANGSTTFTDSSVNALTVTANGSAAISTAQSKFGGASVYFDGQSLLRTPATVGQLGADDFTIEFWIYPTAGALAGTAGLFGQRINFEGNYGFVIDLFSGQLRLLISSAGNAWNITEVQNNNASILENVWQHVAITREMATWRVFINGVLVSNFDYSAPLLEINSDCTIGAGGFAGQYFPGYVDEFRVVRGVALYTADFTPPTAPFRAVSDVTPTDVLGCDLWLDSTGDIGEVNGTIVTWADKSGNGRTATPADYAPAPFVAAGEGPKGQNVVRFSGDPNVLDVGYQFNLKNSSGFVVVGQTVAPEDCSTSRPERILSFQPANGFDWQQNDAMVFHHNQNNAGSGLHAVDLYNTGTSVPYSVNCPMEWTVFSYVIDGAGNVRFRRNGVDEETATFSSLANKAGAELLLGFGGDFTQASALRGDIAEIVIFDHALGDAALIALERGLINRCLPPPPFNLLDGLLGYWTLNGNSNDFTANNYDLTAEGSSSFDAGKISGGLVCSGGGYYYPSNSAFNPAGNDYSVTVNLWFKTDAAYGPVTGRPHLMSTTPEVGPYYGWTICWADGGWPPENPGCLYADVRGASNGLWISSNNNYTDGQWHMVTLVIDKDNNTSALWVDGVKKGEIAFSDVGGQYAKMTVGYREGLWNSPFYGTIDEAGIWSRALTGAEISALYNSGAGLSPVPAGDTVLLLHMDGANGSTTFTDSSANEHTVTSNGNAAISTTESKFGGASGDFTGYGDNVQVTPTDPEMFAYGTGDFTIEGWIYPTAPDPGTTIYSQTESGFNYLALQISDGNLFLDHGLTNPGTYVWGPAVSNNTWQHFALCRHNGVMRLYLDGVGGDPVNSDFDFNNLTYLPTIGGYSHTDTYAFNGYIDELRITKGAAVYTGNFTPPSLPFGVTPALLLHMDGANGSTTFTDSGPNAVTVASNGSAAISTAQSKFGGSSLSLGNGYLDSGDFSDFEDMSEGDWTLEAWVWRPSSIDNATVLNLSNAINVPFGLHFWIGSDDALRWDEGTQQCAIGGVVPREQWVHVAAARANGTVTIYVNGTSVGSSAVAPQAGPYRLLIGAMQPNNIGFTSEMYIDELRIIKGYAAYTANFTPPTTPFNT